MLQIKPDPVKPKDRRVVPACLDGRAPIDYRILDESGRPVPLTLVGYRLTAGRCYTLEVDVVGVVGAALHFLTPRSVAELVGESKESYSRNGSQCVKFEPSDRSNALSRLFHFSRPAVLEVRIEFKNGREDFYLTVPVVISKSIWLNILPLCLPSVADIIKQVATPTEGFRIGSLVLMFGVGILLTISLWLLDQYLLYRRAVQMFKNSQRGATDKKKAGD